MTILTKEECLKAVKGLHVFAYFGANHHDKEYVDKDYSILVRLINEHFELKTKYSKILDDVHEYRREVNINKCTIRNLMVHFGVTTIQELTSLYYNYPLKFEELHEGIWVWDSLIRRYDQILEINQKEKHFFFRYTAGVFKFEENRFYRYEVKE